MRSQRRDYFWNSLAGLINAAEVVVMSMIVTRYGHLSDAGILSLAFAVGNVMMTIGKFGGRIFQVTDSKRQYTLRMYLLQRFCTVVLMFLVLMGVLWIGNYPIEKRYAIIIITLIFAAESWEESFWGYYQSRGALYIGAQMFASRWIVILFVFAICMNIFGNMIMSLLLSAVSGGMVFVLWILLLRFKSIENSWEICDVQDNRSIACLFSLFRQTTPLFFASFGYIFISGIPKFAIDRYMNDEVQACYGFVAMPVFVIGMLNQFIYQPTIVALTNKYYSHEIDSFRKDVRKQIVIVSAISIVCILVAAFIGVPVLSFIYHTNLIGYRIELIILQVSGSFLALSGYFTIILTLMRCQKIILMGYLIVVCIGLVLLNISVKCAGTVGASLGYAVLMIVLFTYYVISYLKTINSRKGVH